MRRSHEGLRGAAKDNYPSLTEKIKSRPGFEGIFKSTNICNRLHLLLRGNGNTRRWIIMESSQNRLIEKQPPNITENAAPDSVLGRDSDGLPIVLKFVGTDEDKTVQKMNYDNIIGTFAAMIEKYAGAFDFTGKAVRNGA